MTKTNTPAKKTENKTTGTKEVRVDSLLECLVFLTAHYGRAKSAESLTAGLAYDSKNMGPNLFCEAAEGRGLKTKIVERQDLAEIPVTVLPAVLMLGDDRACVLVSVSEGEKTVKVFMPGNNAETEMSWDDLSNDYAGYAIFVQPKVEFSNAQAFDTEDVKNHWFWSLVEQNKNYYGLVLLAAIFINLFGLTSPLFIMTVYDRVIPNSAIETGWALGIGALTVFMFDFAIRTLRAYLIDFSGRRIDVMAARRIYDQVLNMKLALRPKSSGAFANMLRDFDSVREFFTSATITGLVDLPFTLIFLFFIFHIGGGIALILLALIAAVVCIGYFLQIPLKAHVRKSTKSAEAKHGLLVETIHGLETIKAVSADGRFRARYGEYVGENAVHGQNARFVSGLSVNIATFLQQIAAVLIILCGMYLVRDGVLSVGGLIACVMLGGRALTPIGQIANLMTKYHQANSALKTLDKIMDSPVERPPHQQFLHRPDLEGKIAFEKVGFSYPGVDRKILDDVSFTIKPGEKVGIIGRIGSGKSTTARLILGLYDADEGSVLADGTDYRQIDPADLRRNIAYIAQDVVLFNGSVRDNITASLPHATEEEVLAAAKASGVHDFMARHPMGYDAPVGEHGEGLSGGQRQAIALARAMLLKPKVMVCDEPTNAMDTQAEAAFAKYMHEQSKDVTMILITHKTVMLPLVDRLILLDQGRVVIDGPRDKVIEALNGGNLEAKA